jgi:hypothetical protein
MGLWSCAIMPAHRTNKRKKRATAKGADVNLAMR